MYLVEYDKLDVTNKVRALVKHASQDFGRHDEAVCLRIDLHVAREDSNRRRRKRVFEISEFLVG